MVKKGNVLGILSDPFGDDREEVLAPFTGVVIGQLMLPLAHEGDALVHLAKVPDHEEAGEVLNEYTSSLTEEDFGLERQCSGGRPPSEVVGVNRFVPLQKPETVAPCRKYLPDLIDE